MKYKKKKQRESNIIYYGHETKEMENVTIGNARTVMVDINGEKKLYL